MCSLRQAWTTSFGFFDTRGLGFFGPTKKDALICYALLYVLSCVPGFSTDNGSSPCLLAHGILGFYFGRQTSFKGYNNFVCPVSLLLFVLCTGFLIILCCNLGRTARLCLFVNRHMPLMQFRALMLYVTSKNTLLTNPFGSLDNRLELFHQLF